MEKGCRGCLRLLPLSDFYTHKGMADGYLNYCKKCVKSRVAKHRQDNCEKIQAYEKWRYRANPKRQQQFLSLPAKRTPEQKRAHNAVRYAIKNGSLVRPGCCSKCGKKCKPEGHHDDYSKYLEVRWLCRSCHCLLHANSNNDS